MFTINLDVSEYDSLVINDLMRMFIIQLIVQVLYYLRHDNVELFSMVFLETTLFILLGIIIYWLLFNKIVIFKNKDKSDLDNYYHNVYSLKGFKV